MAVHWFEIALVGVGVGFLAGLFGKGGSAVATPILAAIGVPPIVAVAAPLPATIPGTLAAARPYGRLQLIDREVLRWSLLVGLPATIIGAIATNWISGSFLVEVTDVVVAALGVRFLCKPTGCTEVVRDLSHRRARMAGVAFSVGIVAGLLANSGGFLLAPLFLTVLKLPVKESFGTSLVVACALAIPGTVVHQALGHLDWAVVGAYAAGSITMAPLGARLALRTDPAKLERLYGAVLTVLGVAFLAIR